MINHNFFWVENFQIFFGSFVLIENQIMSHDDISIIDRRHKKLKKKISEIK